MDEFNIDPSSMSEEDLEIIRAACCDILDIAEAGEMDELEMLAATTCLRHVVVRDSLLSFIAAEGGEIEECMLSMLTRMTYETTSGSAPMATMASIIYWMRNEPELALTALDIALMDEPDYSLAMLTSNIFESGTTAQEVRKILVDSLL